ncbi:UDP-N-acetyl-D-glucosamine dehydrogenase [Wenjunlia vitaminophila]|uniref:UDP-N-acetyl-D-glucosamine dehydrogenase n=1 Tax=Wenjunlia vitaminophila TaxID=76728 RepID=A0A0T6LLR6_WENVI|nr:nucleotide sugar dehydrogenase [Wenjunlia vitaminophila]KRV46849.1 UDP-N-acetyl-D-glucosamine dehydrogenase [Wenjunlia vitaminophila]
MAADLVVIGLGFAGLPLAQAAVAAGMDVIGYDRDEQRVAEVGSGRSPVHDLSAADIRRMLACGFRATTDPDALGRARIAVICEPTPLTEEGTPDLTAVRASAAALARRLRPHSTVIVGSTVHPGTTEDVLRPLLEGSGLRCGVDFHLAVSPTRTDPGNRGHRLSSTPAVVGGATPACADAAAAFLSRLTERVVRARGTREAETVKLLENNYRVVNIALVNEMAVFCHDAGIDLWDVIRCAETKPYGFQAFRPGPGMGGYCTALDPAYLPRRGRTIGYPLRMVELAQEVNQRMPRYLVHRASALLNEDGKAVRGARVLLLGVTYKPDVADTSASPAHQVAARLLELGAQLSYHDPWVPQWRVLDRPVPRADSPYDAAAGADLTLLLQPHRLYDLQGLTAKARRLLDARGVTPAGAAHRL